MARDHARILVDIWSDEEFTALPMSAQRMYFLVLSQRSLTYAGTLPYTPGRWAQSASDARVAQVRRDVRTLADAGYLVLDEATEEVLVRSFIRHDQIMRFPNVAKAMVKQARAIVSPAIRAAFDAELIRLAKEPDAESEKGWHVEDVATLLKEAMHRAR